MNNIQVYEMIGYSLKSDFLDIDIDDTNLDRYLCVFDPAVASNTKGRTILADDPRKYSVPVQAAPV